MLRPPQPSLPSLLSLLLLLPYLPQQNRVAREEGREGGVGDKTPDVPSFDGALPCQCIPPELFLSLSFLPPNSNSTNCNNKIDKSIELKG